jgi:ketosteroid isomerase-like protein
MPDEHRDLARRFIAVFDSGDTATLDEIVADDVTDHNPLPGTGTGRQGIADAVAIYRGAFPDLAVTVDRLVAEDDYVVATGTATGTNTGQLRGAPRPEGRPASPTSTCTESTTGGSSSAGTSRTSPACSDSSGSCRSRGLRDREQGKRCLTRH